MELTATLARRLSQMQANCLSTSDVIDAAYNAMLKVADLLLPKFPDG
jgi:hypothetical protein